MNCVLKVNPPIANEELNALFASAWPDHQMKDFKPILERALIYVCAYEGARLVGFAKVIGDGGIHGFLLDPTVVPDRRRNGIGKRLVDACGEEASQRGVEYLHVDYESNLRKFYSSCGFLPTEAGLRRFK